ncbi:hypothetical protein F503_08855 [Ophiostoma piceae UAMH 11346]|uniref:Uncharacterized protein n=1 Tax=Ophiostoma piceae (strain UAMH 11346) TaxID=1262450 RepID=S3C9S7_OPHP1|nr:hypothetical protein F503_08855 [Ophiostoma piceae UAMH 11346]
MPRKAVDLSLSDPRDLRFQPLNRRQEERIRKELEAKHEENLQKLVQQRLEQIQRQQQQQTAEPTAAPAPPPEKADAETHAPIAIAAIEAPPPAEPEAKPDADPEKMPYAVLTLKGSSEGLETANIQLNFKDSLDQMAIVPVVEASPVETAEAADAGPQVVEMKEKRKTHHLRSKKSHRASLGVKKHPKSKMHRSKSKRRNHSRSRSKTKNEEQHHHRGRSRSRSRSRGRRQSRDTSCASRSDHSDLESDISRLARKLHHFRSRKSSTRAVIDSVDGSDSGSDCSSCESSSSTEVEDNHHKHHMSRRGRVARRERHLSSVRCSSCGHGAHVYSDMDDDGLGNCEFRIHGGRGRKNRNQKNGGSAMMSMNQDGTGSDTKGRDESNDSLPALPPIGGMAGSSPDQTNGWINGHQSHNDSGPNALLPPIPSPDRMGGWDPGFNDPVYGKRNHNGSHQAYPVFAPPPSMSHPQHACHGSYSPPHPYDGYHHPYHHPPSHHHGCMPYPYAYAPHPPPYVPNPPHSYGPPMSPTMPPGGYPQPSSAYPHYGPPSWAMGASPPAPPPLHSSPTRNKGKGRRNNGFGEYQSRGPSSHNSSSKSSSNSAGNGAGSWGWVNNNDSSGSGSGFGSGFGPSSSSSHPGYNPFDGKAWSKENIALVRKMNAQLTPAMLAGGDRWTELQNQFFAETSRVVSREGIAYWAAGVDIAGGSKGSKGSKGSSGSKGGGTDRGNGKSKKPEPDTSSSASSAGGGVAW